MCNCKFYEDILAVISITVALCIILVKHFGFTLKVQSLSALIRDGESNMVSNWFLPLEYDLDVL